MLAYNKLIVYYHINFNGETKSTTNTSTSLSVLGINPCQFTNISIIPFIKGLKGNASNWSIPIKGESLIQMVFYTSMQVLLKLVN